MEFESQIEDANFSIKKEQNAQVSDTTDDAIKSSARNIILRQAQNDKL